MGYNARNDEIRDNITRMKRDWAAQKAALATVRRFNAANGKAWFWPKIAAALVSKHHWLIIVCDACGTVVDLDLRVKPRDPEASIRVRCAGYNARDATATEGHASVAVDLKTSVGEREL
jgi:hypothetical protein